MHLTGLHECKYGRRMSDLLTPDDIERMAREAGKTIKAVCEEAGVAQSTFSRWRRGHTEPTLDVYRRISAAASTPARPAATPEAVQ